MVAAAANPRPSRSIHGRHWTLDPGVIYLNHGIFGACPLPVLEKQAELRARLERQPVQFLVRDLEGLLDEARSALGNFVGASADDLVFLTNATAGVNTVLRWAPLAPGDEVLVTTHVYNACNNALLVNAERAGARVVVANVPFPLRASAEVVQALLKHVSPNTRLALVDHVTSPTGLVFPIQEIVEALGARGVDVLVDGAHAPGMVPIQLDRLGAAYYTGNCHKWLSTPKGSAFLHVRKDRQKHIRPLSISHGTNSRRTDRSRFQLEFENLCGTDDPTPYLCIPTALKFWEGALPGGFAEVMATNRALALEARRLLCDAAGVAPPAPEEMIGALAAIPLPDDPRPPGPQARELALQAALRESAGIEVPVFPFPAPPHRVIRVAAQLYNTVDEYRLLATELRRLLQAEG
jgi:isopenicillin-N epimerase